MLQHTTQIVMPLWPVNIEFGTFFRIYFDCKTINYAYKRSVMVILTLLTESRGEGEGKLALAYPTLTKQGKQH
jgi:hypothetical protein